MWETIEPGYTSRCVSAEIRGRLGAERLSGIKFAAQVGMSQNYLATRLRDEKSFTVDDLERICRYFDVDVREFVEAAERNHGDRVFIEMKDLRREQDNEMDRARARAAEARSREASEAASNVDLSAEPSAAEPKRRDDSTGDFY